MTPQALLLTSSILGLFVLFGGLYGSLYAASAVFNRPGLRAAGLLCYAGLLCCLAVALFTPLLWPWKLLLAVSAIGDYWIPPVTLRYVGKLHDAEGASP